MTSPPTSIDDIHGWFWPEDRALFAHFLGDDAVLTKGDLVELGTFLGKSAVFMGDYLHEGETFVALDLFHNESDEANVVENRNYPLLSREKFETNYLAFHDELPVIVEGPSSSIVDHVAPATARFIHVDASHLYEHVAVDVQSSRSLIAPGGVVVFDDYRAVHTPGVSAAVWEATVRYGFRPILLSPQKMYGTFDLDPAPHRDRVLTLLDRDPRWEYVVEDLLGVTIVRAQWNDGSPAVPPVVAQHLNRVDQRLREIERSLSRQARKRDRQFRRLSEQIQQGRLTTRLRRRLRAAAKRG